MTTATLPFRLKSEEKSWILISSMVDTVNFADCDTRLLGASCCASCEWTIQWHDEAKTGTHCE